MGRLLAGWLTAALLLALAPASQGATPAPARAHAQRYFLLVFNAPRPGQQAEYNRWYDQEHAPDVVSIPGFVSAQRYEYNPLQLREVARRKPKYLVLYELRTRDLPAVLAEVRRRLKSGQTRISPALDPDSGQMYLYRARGARVAGIGGEAADAAAGDRQAYCQVVFGDATSGQDAAFNAWYDSDHVPALLGMPGFVWAQRATLSDVQLVPIDDPSRYLTLFRIETRDLAAVLRQGHRGTEPPASFDRARTFGYTYRAIGPELSGAAVRAARSDRRALSTRSQTNSR